MNGKLQAFMNLSSFRRPPLRARRALPLLGAIRIASVLLAAFVALGACITLAASAALTASTAVAASTPSGAGPDDSSASLFGAPNTLTYDKEYPVIGYAGRAQNNAVARLQERIDRGEVKLEYRAPRGYLDSLLKALRIDPSSQALVYSHTSLQTGAISAATPRAIYFNDNTYVGWVQGVGRNIEIAAMDSKLGQVFYTLPNRPSGTAQLQRKILDCLACHDTYELSGGGVPRFLLMSTYTDVLGNQLTHEGQIITSDQTPLKYRWGGWYVTGQSGNQVHLGNIQVHSVYELVHLDKVRRGNLDTLDGLFNTRPYLTDKSDIVALLVLQHQVDVQNLITRVNFEVREALARAAKGRRRAGASGAGVAADLSEKTREALKGYMDSLVDAMLFVDATKFTSQITGNSGFQAWFEAQGPRDSLGRSLRALDLHTRLFKYPLSYLVYSASFDGLPGYAKRYIYGRFADILTGRDDSDTYSYLSDSDRKAILEILTATKPAFARFLASKGSG
jgi:hypothetical protein